MGTATEFCGADVGAARTMQTFVSDGIALTIQQVSYGKVDIEAVLSGEAAAEMIVATSDGRGYTGQWCACGVANTTDVRVERWTAEGRVFHGWACESCRGLVQSG